MTAPGVFPPEQAEADRADAARFRWLVENCSDRFRADASRWGLSLEWGAFVGEGTDIRAAIDAAMRVAAHD